MLTLDEIEVAKQLKAAKTALLTPEEVFAKQSIAKALKAEKAAAKRVAHKSANCKTHPLSLGRDECLSSDSENDECEDDSGSKEYSVRKRVRCNP